MSILEGEIDSNWRFNSRTGVFAPVSITAEEQLVQEFQEFAGNYGFTLNEVPDISSLSITEVKRVSDSQIFTHTTNASVGNTEYFFDYGNDVPILFFNSINDGETFLVKYSGVGGAVNAKNLLSIAARAGNFETRLQSLIRTNPFNRSIINQNVYLYNNWAVVNDLSITGNCEIRPNAPNSIGVIEILGDLTLANVAVLKTYRCIFLIHGSIKIPAGTAQIVGQDGESGGNGNRLDSGSMSYLLGAGGGGTGQAGTNGFINDVSNFGGGTGGYCLPDHNTQTNSLGARLTGGFSLSAATAATIGGGGGGGINFSDPSYSPASGAIGGGGGGGGGGYLAFSPLPILRLFDSGAVGGSGTVFHGAGGRGGDAVDYGGGGLGLGGDGGGSGGTGLIFFVLGTISPDAVFYSGRGGAPGMGGFGVTGWNPEAGQTGPINIYSKYTGTPPGTYNADAVTYGSAGNITFNKLGSSSNYTIFEINKILYDELSLVHGSAAWRIADKLSVSI